MVVFLEGIGLGKDGTGIGKEGWDDKFFVVC